MDSFLDQDIPKAIFLVWGEGGLLCTGLACFLAYTEGNPFITEVTRALIELVLQQPHVVKDPLNAQVIFNHLLVMAAALIGRAGPNVQAQ
jgi:hypothetical protein